MQKIFLRCKNKTQKLPKAKISVKNQDLPSLSA